MLYIISKQQSLGVARDLELIPSTHEAVSSISNMDTFNAWYNPKTIVAPIKILNVANCPATVAR